MASVNKRIASITSHMPGVKDAVRAEGKEVEARAKALFAHHNRPGRHEIRGVREDTDYLVYMAGPVPIVIEYGREGFEQKLKDGSTRHVGPMQGLHILGRAAGL